jgi:hypothetical protein
MNDLDLGEWLLPAKDDDSYLVKQYIEYGKLKRECWAKLPSNTTLATCEWLAKQYDTEVVFDAGKPYLLLATVAKNLWEESDDKN